MANDGRNVVIAGRSIGDPEGGPQSYTLVYLHGEDLSVAQRSVEDDGPAVLVTHPRDVLFATGPPHVVSGPDEFRVRTWLESPVKYVRGRIDLGGWFPLDSCGAGAWEAALPGDRLAKGEHTFEAEVVVGSGRRGGQRMSFMVDPTGRFTAVPATRPLVERTSFC